MTNMMLLHKAKMTENGSQGKVRGLENEGAGKSIICGIQNRMVGVFGQPLQEGVS